jgi:hypothetical protein
MDFHQNLSDVPFSVLEKNIFNVPYNIFIVPFDIKIVRYVSSWAYINVRGFKHSMSETAHILNMSRAVLIQCRMVIFGSLHLLITRLQYREFILST